MAHNVVQTPEYERRHCDVNKEQTLNRHIVQRIANRCAIRAAVPPETWFEVRLASWAKWLTADGEIASTAASPPPTNRTVLALHPCSRKPRKSSDSLASTQSR